MCGGGRPAAQARDGYLVLLALWDHETQRSQITRDFGLRSSYSGEGTLITCVAIRKRFFHVVRLLFQHRV